MVSSVENISVSLVKNCVQKVSEPFHRPSYRMTPMLYNRNVAAIRGDNRVQRQQCQVQRPAKIMRPMKK
ncbi:hypothetical protein J6590_067356 [Homalodisca vitripennis]|nr:hypothetical protein J6590_067356 [Homalodisca vitripennis]